MRRILEEKKNCEVLSGELLDPTTYATHLAGFRTVVHLAAVTGKAAPREYDEVNRHGTELLLEECRRAGVTNFLHVSTIAVRYKDRSAYPYADSKAASEAAVERSGLRYAIVRPTVVISNDSPVWISLSKLGKAPMIIVPGDGRVRLQPIYLDDLIDCLVTVLDKELFTNEAFDLGGPEPVTIEKLLATLHRLHRGHDPFVVHLPLRPIRAVLQVLERVFLSRLPVTSGQLSLFGNDGTIESNKVFDRHASSMKGVQAMIELALGNG